MRETSGNNKDRRGQTPHKKLDTYCQKGGLVKEDGGANGKTISDLNSQLLSAPKDC